jgi:hypothetical protein
MFADPFKRLGNLRKPINKLKDSPFCAHRR